MKCTLLAGLALIAVTLPAQAQEGVPLLRVYIDAPYFYDIVVQNDEGADPRSHDIVVSVVGKEVGSSQIIYDCETGEFGEDVVQAWSGGAGDFLPAALLSYRNLYC